LDRAPHAARNSQALRLRHQLSGHDAERVTRRILQIRIREVVPVEASFAAKIVGALAEDCGPCTQLCVDMALEAGMPRDQIEAVLRRDPRAMHDTTRLAFRFADAVVRRSADDGEFRDAVRAQWGQKGVIDLTMGLQMGRMFPMVKAGLGYAKECRRVTVDGHNVDVIKQAA
jgi:hypothetical protein